MAKDVREKGFTLVEIVTILPPMILITATMLAVMITLFSDMVVRDARVQLAQDGQAALLSIQDEMLLATNFADKISGIDSGTNSMVDDNPPVGGWTYNTTPQTMIVYTIATTKAQQDPTAQLIYYNIEGCASADQTNLNPPYLDNLIYFVKANDNSDGTGTLYRRTLVDQASLDTCTDTDNATNPRSFRRQSCPVGGTTTKCGQTVDSVLARGVQSLNITYYNNVGTALGAGVSPLSATRADITLTLQKTAAGETLTHTTKLSVRKANTGDPDAQ